MALALLQCLGFIEQWLGSVAVAWFIERWLGSFDTFLSDGFGSVAVAWLIELRLGSFRAMALALSMLEQWLGSCSGLAYRAMAWLFLQRLGLSSGGFRLLQSRWLGKQWLGSSSAAMVFRTLA